MSDHTKIEWTDATANVVNGCSVVSPGCTNCYAMKLAGGRMKSHPTRAGLTRDSKAGPIWTGEVRFHEPALQQVLRWQAPRMIFWNAHGDLFHENVPDEWIDRCFAAMALTPQHTHQVLTKRPERMRAYLKIRKAEPPRMVALGDGTLGAHPFNRELLPPANVWLGTSVEDQQRADERIPILLDTPAAVRWLSMEPLLGPVQLPFSPGTAWCPQCKEIVPDPLGSPHEYWHGTPIGDRYDPALHCATGESMINWVVLGGESGPGARPMHPDWARSIRDQCASAGVPFLFKQWGDWLPLPQYDADGRWWIEQDVDVPYASGQRSTHRRLGKKHAGRLLDGVQHDGYPA